ncbi:MAG: hypothetical protein C5B51_01970 [Terriglobia bacterium]|nr:MAG: hypothetical protein C5B51_01970 [Terriglobia bacterium]
MQLAITYVVAALSFATAAVGPVSAQNLSPLQWVTGDSSAVPSYGDQQYPAIARGGSQFLAVWQDTRGITSAHDILAARLDTSGKLIDTTPIVVTQAAADQTSPRVVWNGQNWLVVWFSQTPTQSYWATNILAARVSPQGAVLDPVPLAISNTDSGSILFAAASDGTNWIVVWEGGSAGSSDVRAARISPGGSLLDPTGVVLIPGTYYLRFGLEMSCTSAVCLLLWNEWQAATNSNDILSLRISPALQVLDSKPRAIAATLNVTEQNARAASDGAEFFVVWEGVDPITMAGAVVGTRVSAQGAPADTGGKTISSPTAYGPLPAVDWDGTNWVLAWTDTVIKTARVAASGAVLDPGGVTIDPAINSYKAGAAIAGAAGGGARVLWHDMRAGGGQPNDVFLALVAANGQPSAGTPISMAAPSQQTPRVAASGSRYLTVYLSAVSGTNRIMAQLIDSGGVPLSQAPILLATGANLSTPSVAWNGSVFLAVWTDTAANAIYGARVQPDGTVLDATPVLIMSGAEPDAAANGGAFFVVGSNAPGNPEYRFPYGVLVNGTTGKPGTPAAIGGSFIMHPRVAPLGSGWIAVWQHHATHDDPHSTLNGAFIQSNGTPLPEIGIESLASMYHYNPAIGGNGSIALVTWEDPRVSNADWNIYAKRIQADHTILDGTGIAVTTAPNNQTHSTVGWDGNRFVVAWEDLRNITFFLDARPDIYAARVDPANGAVLDPAGFAVLNGNVPEMSPAVVGSGGSSMIAASAFRAEQPRVSFRTGYRMLDAIANKPPAAVAAANPYSGPAPLVVNFISSGSFDPDGSIVARLWDFGDGSTSTVADPVHTYAAPGSFTASLTLTDNLGAPTSTSLLITPLTVTNPNQPPIAVASVTPGQGNAPLAVAFSSAGSRDPDGTITSYSWNFGDGASSTVPNPGHTYAAPGVYTALLQVTDNSGAKSSTSVTVTALGVMRSTAISMRAFTRFAVFTVYANVTVSDATGAPVPGATVTATWTVPQNLQQQQSAVTDATGVASFSISPSTNRGTFTIAIDDIAKGAYTFDRANSVLTKSLTR